MILAASFSRPDAAGASTGLLVALERFWGPAVFPRGVPGSCWLAVVAEQEAILGVVWATFAGPAPTKDIEATPGPWVWSFTDPRPLEEPIPWPRSPFPLGLALVGEDLHAELSLLLGV